MGIIKANMISFAPKVLGSKNSSSNKLLKDIQSKKKEMNNLRFCVKIIRVIRKIKTAVPI